METLEIKIAEFKMKPEMRCAGMCKGSCNCPTGHCRCNMSKVYSSASEGKKYGALSSDSYQFRQVA